MRKRRMHARQTACLLQEHHARQCRCAPWVSVSEAAAHNAAQLFRTHRRPVVHRVAQRLSPEGSMPSRCNALTGVDKNVQIQMQSTTASSHPQCRRPLLLTRLLECSKLKVGRLGESRFG